MLVAYPLTTVPWVEALNASKAPADVTQQAVNKAEVTIRFGRKRMGLDNC
ncbi:Uncharacterised protein [Pseudomonas fluorescens]|uniref:Uncharacterized protein n=1 Tax=Pseudomonas fluorescens TaxID=294 RepID=A0A3S4SM30_PSEFL|nr:Uncharacterised protein [Pseudomonas fluorescens]